MSTDSTTPVESNAEAVSLPPRPRKKFQRKKHDGLWLMSFSDMSIILISFFILQLSFSTISQQKADVLREAIQNSKFLAKKDTPAETMSLKLGRYHAPWEAHYSE